MADKDNGDPSVPFSNDNPSSKGSQYSGEYIPPGVPTPPAHNVEHYYGNQAQHPLVPPNEKNALLALIFGLIGISACQILAPAGWILGAKSRRKIKESNGALAGDGFALAGMICGIVGTVVLVMGILYFLFFILVFGGLALNS